MADKVLGDYYVITDAQPFDDATIRLPVRRLFVTTWGNGDIRVVHMLVEDVDGRGHFFKDKNMQSILFTDADHDELEFCKDKYEGTYTWVPKRLYLSRKK